MSYRFGEYQEAILWLKVQGATKVTLPTSEGPYIVEFSPVGPSEIPEAESLDYDKLARKTAEHREFITYLSAGGGRPNHPGPPPSAKSPDRKS